MDPLVVPVGRPLHRNEAEQWGGLSGRLRRPVLTMHIKADGMAFVSHESRYKELVEGANCGDLLLQAYLDGTGHTTFTATQYKTVLASMEHWLDTGEKPGALLLPGFDLAFTPPEWNY